MYKIKDILKPREEVLQKTFQGVIQTHKVDTEESRIEELIGDEVVAIFIDEIENWYGSFDPETQAHLIERNETFWEHLLEVANDPKRKLFVFITFLEEKEGLKKVFNRTKPVRIDVSAIEDREKVILHRLFENIESADKEKIEDIVAKYIEKYTHPIKMDDFLQYKRRMVKTYPFHPLLLDTLIQIYEAATERQDIRGMLNVLADAIKDTYDKKDLILLADIDENAFRGIDLHLVEKYNFDFQRVKDIGYAREILKTILIFTLNEKTHGATESDILLSIFSPTQGHTLNSILMDLENIYGKPHYLHKENGVYLFKHEVNLYALLEREKNKIAEDDIKRKIAEIVKKDVFDNRAFIYGFDEIPRSLEPGFVIFDPKYTPPLEDEEIPPVPELKDEEENKTVVLGKDTTTVVQRKEKKEITLTGNSPRVILSQVEARTSEKDEFEEITIIYKFNTKLSKQDMMKFIKQLPSQEDTQIKAEVVLWREKDET
ncbi:MAG: ATP-binding protein [Candidatus Desulfofervidaceae bacterium]|nr:ATP-binding protein [Candidatus Desulfofervidaceae bacterium]